MILYEGPSRLDGEPIVVILTGLNGSSKNVKTGNMLQTWILRADIQPLDALRSGADVSICGQCPLRGLMGKKRPCYVRVEQAPLVVWKKYKRGGYPAARSLRDIRAVGRDRVVRLGSYGDPGAVPTKVWEHLTCDAKSWTGYTHQWRKRPSLRQFCMASVDNLDEYRQAKERGWRTFRVGDQKLDTEVQCPASEEGGFKSTCDRCTLCMGTQVASSKDIVIRPHGGGRKLHPGRLRPGPEETLKGTP